MYGTTYMAMFRIEKQQLQTHPQSAPAYTYRANTFQTNMMSMHKTKSMNY